MNDQDLRKSQLEGWLNSHFKNEPWRMEVASADASFRRYFRVYLENKTMIAMDAPPDKEDVGPFIHVAKAFKALNEFTQRYSTRPAAEW